MLRVGIFLNAILGKYGLSVISLTVPANDEKTLVHAPSGLVAYPRLSKEIMTLSKVTRFHSTVCTFYVIRRIHRSVCILIGGRLHVIGGRKCAAGINTHGAITVVVVERRARLTTVALFDSITVSIFKRPNRVNHCAKCCPSITSLPGAFIDCLEG